MQKIMSCHFEAMPKDIQVRCAILPLHMGTCRWQGRETEKIMCNLIETKEQFMFHCNKYNNISANF